MRKTIFTLLLGLLAISFVNAQTVIFDPAMHDEGAFQGSDAMTIVDIEGAKYLKVELAGWSSTFQVSSTVLNANENVFTAVAKFEEGTSGFTTDQVMSFVKLIDNTSGSEEEVGIIKENSSADFTTYMGDIALAGASVTTVQLAGQETTGWSAVEGDFLYLGKVTAAAFDKNTMFDPASVDASALPEGMEVVEEAGEKLLKVKLNAWSSNLPIMPFDMGENNTWTFKVKYEEGESGFDNANTQVFVQAMDASAAALWYTTENPAPADLTEISGDAKAGTIVSSIQLAGQETTDWNAVTDAYLYLSKITVSKEEAQLAEAPITTTLAYSAEAADISIDGLYDDAYGETENEVVQVALNSVGGDIADTDSKGVWLATADMDNFYLYVEVSDDTPIELGDSDQPWMNDGIEIFLGAQNRRYVGGARIAGEQHQIRINFGTEGPAKGDFGMDGFFGDNDTTNVEFAVISSSSGYVVEARIPWATWFRTNTMTNQEALDAISLSEGKKIAFEVSVLDADAGLNQRESILNWANNTGEDKAYLTNEYFGEVTLQGGWPTTIQRSAAKELKVYPNPAYNQINIDMTDATSVEIYNVIGSKVAAKQLNGERTISVSELNRGVYIMKVTDANGKAAVAKFNKE